MVQIGEAKIPDLDPHEAIEIAGTLVHEFGGEPPDEETFARSIGHDTANSGAFRSKLADLRRYGLVSSRGISATRLAYDLVYPDNEDQFYQNEFEMLQNIPLLSEFYERVKKMEPDPEYDIADIVIELTEADREEVNDSISKIVKLYNEMHDAQNRSDIQLHNVWSTENSFPNNNMKEDIRGGFPNVRKHGLFSDHQNPSEITPGDTSDGAAIYVQVGSEELRLAERNEHNLELAIQFLNSKLNEIKSESSRTPLEPE